MPEKDPLHWQFMTYITWMWVFFLSGWGGLVSFIAKMKRGEARVFNLMELMGEICISSFSGLLTFFFCRWGDIDMWLTAALVGISGHMGSRAIYQMEKWAEHRFNALNIQKLSQEGSANDTQTK